MHYRSLAAAFVVLVISNQSLSSETFPIMGFMSSLVAATVKIFIMQAMAAGIIF